MNVLVTGGTGFVGNALLERLSREPATVVSTAGRRWAQGFVGTHTPINDIGPDAQWGDALEGVDAVVHAAARVHITSSSGASSEVEFQRVNVEGTLNLARQAANAGVRRFVFVSSIKVNGDLTEMGKPFRPDDVPAPTDAYGRSKLEAELGLRRLVADSAMKLVIVRCPLVYGPRVGANFLSMMRWLSRGVPLPFRNVANLRSLIAVENLVDLLTLSLRHPAAAGRVLLASDNDDVSTPQLLSRLGRAMGRPARLFPVPNTALRAAGYLLGAQGVLTRLCGSLHVDISETLSTLEWQPPFSMDESLRKTAQQFLASENR